MNLPCSSVRPRRVVPGAVIFLLLLLTMFFLTALRGLAQSIQGSIIGTVADTAGAVVPGATVTLTNLDEGSIRTAVSSSTGEFQFIDAKAARYSVEVSGAGFERWATTGVILEARQQLRIDVSLTVGNVQQEVTVSADTISPINTDTPAISAVYTAA